MKSNINYTYTVNWFMIRLPRQLKGEENLSISDHQLNSHTKIFIKDPWLFGYYLSLYTKRISK